MALTTRIIKVFNNLGQNTRASRVANENIATVKKAQKFDFTFKNYTEQEILDIGNNLSEEAMDNFSENEEKEQINYFA